MNKTSTTARCYGIYTKMLIQLYMEINDI